MNENKWFPYFTNKELACKCGACHSDGLEMNNDFMSKIIELRQDLNIPFIVSSAYRCPAHNNAVSSTGDNGPHTTGRAIDIVMSGENAFKLAMRALDLGFTGLGVNQKGASRFIHLDDLGGNYPRPRIWSY